MNPIFKTRTRTRRAAAVLALCASVCAPTHAARAQDDRPRQDQVVQDGIAVKPLNRNRIGSVWRDIAAPE